MRSFSCAVVLVLVACRSGGEAESASESAPEPAQGPGDADHGVAPTPAPESTPESTPAPEPEAEPPPRELDWSVPPCPLTYHYRAELGAGGAEIELEFDLVMSAQGEGAALHHGPIQMRQTMEGKVYSEGEIATDGFLADVHLARGDGVWLEVEGPTKLWSANDSAPGLMFMWPALPRQKREGATIEWTVQGNHENPAVARTEAARGSTELPEDWQAPEWEPQEPGTPTVTLEAWEDVDGGARKAILVVDEAPESFPIPDPIADPEDEETATMRQTGRYEVLESGRLLDAQVTIEFQMGSVKAVQAATLKLTKDCSD